jgi:hypothetical protein
MKAGKQEHDNKRIEWIYETQLDLRRKPADKKTTIFCADAPNGLRYPRWGGRRNAVRLEKW